MCGREEDGAGVPDALTLCNSCDIRPSLPDSPAGYCAECDAAARPFVAVHRFRPCGVCGGSPDIHNPNRGRDFIGHEYR